MKPNDPCASSYRIDRHLIRFVAMATALAPGLSAQVDDDEGDIIELSPFVVRGSERDVGYYAENTLAGSRLNTNIGDLAASITIVTKQQLEDTAALNTNDVFMYEANTEGVHTYTPLLLNRGTAKDTAGAHSTDSGAVFSHQNANRVRGIGRVDTAINNYLSLQLIPFDSYNVDGVEISRGPNSILFGLGSPAGIVNTNTAKALLDVNSYKVSFRIDDVGSARAWFNVNQRVIDKKLAVYVAGVSDRERFNRKPSNDDTDRLYAAFTARPHPNTVIRGNFEYFENSNRRPNEVMPRDFVTPWIAAGRPVWNTLDSTISILNTGALRGPFLSTSTLPAGFNRDTAFTNVNSPEFVASLATQDYGRSATYINQGEWIHRQRLPGNFGVAPYANFPSNADLAADPVLSAFANRRTTQSTAAPTPTNTTTWYAPVVTDKSLYNYEKYNLTSVNFGEADATTYNLELEQRLARNLFLQLGWFRQSYNGVQNYTMGQQQAASLTVDTNTHLTDGSPNPHFLSLFVDEIQPDTFTMDDVNDNLRAMLAYEYDFKNHDGFLQWLGRHRVMALASRQDLDIGRTRARATIAGGDPRYQPNMTNPGWSYWNNHGIRRIYYVGDVQNGVTHAPGKFGNPGYGGPTQSSIRTYNWDTGQWENADVLLETALSHATTFRSERSIKSYSGVLQSWIWEDRIITTLGVREDEYSARTADASGLSNAEMYPDGYLDKRLVYNNWQQREEVSGTTTTTGVVFRPIPWLSLFYNRSDNFNPPTSAGVDAFGNALGKPEGEGEDWGFALSLLENKLVARLNWFEVTNTNERAGTAGTLMTRTLRMDHDFFERWAEVVVRARDGEDITADFLQTPATAAQIAAVEQITGLPYGQGWPPSGVASTQTNLADGQEFQLIYNPIPNWTMKLTIGRQETSYSKVAPEWDAWVATRLPVWQAATAPDLAGITNVNFGAAGGAGSQVSLANFWNGYGYIGDISLGSTQGFTSTANWYDLAVIGEVSLAKALEGLQAPGQRKNSAAFMTNYLFVDGPMKNVSVGGSLRWADEAVVGFYGDEADLDDRGRLRRSDPNRPIFDDELFNVDLWIGYTRLIINDSVKMRIQLNVRNAFESGELRPILYNWDGTPAAYRIIEPRRFILTASFEF